MKKLFIILTFVFTFSMLADAAHAENMVTMKLKRGVTNIFTSPLEISNKVYDHFKTPQSKPSLVVGTIPSVLHGIAYMAMRMGSGFWDIVTSNLEAPRNGEPLLKPDYVWQK